MKARKVCFGADMVETDIKKNKVKLLIISFEASERTKNKFIKLGNEYKISVIIDGTIEELSKAIGKSNKAVIGIRDENFAKSIQKKYDGGDIIG